ncbi:biotin--[acetyl-CoA-carboxylase] ligase [Dethiobacter alkaliphilus]|uniref:biotin--[acetyl-CoA-carboxylase] ligase n=1 Tax=Dethiobacter alkaliphilus TaxID=427926 RepID=UPI002226E15C|nr:biotin--[acetyl-CoA-carboxylase] ligase [Dethiobacter alkaliphilus]MCW3489162.1 biotin--[acetyl-CoA-carboxylase] ligase [Dethiobacter alkaliphilus]
MKETLLAILKEHSGAYVSGEELSNRMQVSRTAVWKHIGGLREEGYEIESAPRLGYRLVAVPDLLLPLEIHDGLKTEVMGKKVYHYREVDSTNRVARELARAGEAEGAVVLAEAQSAGRGRLGRAWNSPCGGIWLSLILRPKLPPYKAQLLTLMAAVAATEATAAVSAVTPGIKWPNDLMINGKKLAGILTEVSAEMEQLNYIVLGLGINANIPADWFAGELEQIATSIMAQSGEAVSRVAWVQAFLRNMEQEYMQAEQIGFEDVLKRWRRYSVTLGKGVDVQLADHRESGTAVDIDEQGALLVRTESGVKTFWAGDVSLRPDDGK